MVMLGCKNDSSMTAGGHIPRSSRIISGQSFIEMKLPINKRKKIVAH